MILPRPTCSWIDVKVFKKRESHSEAADAVKGVSRRAPD